jgi:LuxR family transcriptional regulator, quorum-sensing system regulator BjaR1
LSIEADTFGFIERCGVHSTPKDLLDDLSETVKAFGFEHLILSGVPLGGQKLAPMVELNGWPAGWFERYIDQEHAAVDGVCIWSAKSRHPFFWSDVPERWSGTDGSKRVANEATEFGIRSGFAVPMLSLEHWQSVLSFASPLKHCDISRGQQAQLITMAIFAGMSIQALGADPATDEALLSDRQKEVLLWAAGGKTAWETSVILQISEETVWFHQKAARRALGVATTTQAIVEAIRRRLIHP